jgi:type II secretory pathway pseudopilin PulG
MFVRISSNNARRRKQAGYSLLMAIFMVATVLILLSAAVPSILTQGRRERETELVWRGEQYERAIALYFRKFGRYPTNLDDLTKQTNGTRFMRKAYTDPMNKEDGSWRLIYVGPNGQLIGSLRPAPGTSTSNRSASNTSTSNTSTSSTSASGASTSGTNSTSPQPQPLMGTVIGGNIIGVASKMKEPSLRVYHGGDTYEQWEFIWNPVQQGQIPGQQQSPVNQNSPSGSQGAPGTVQPTPGNLPNNP